MEKDCTLRKGNYLLFASNTGAYSGVQRGHVSSPSVFEKRRKEKREKTNKKHVKIQRKKSNLDPICQSNI